MLRPDWLDQPELIPDPLGHGERAVRFLRKLRHPKSQLPGQPFQLDPWQEAVIRRIYGPRDEYGRRLVRRVVLLVPLTLPISAVDEEFTVTMHRDDAAHKLDVKIASPKVKLRGSIDCYYCSGNGLCPNDYPPGSGRNYSNITDGSCNGTGRCYHCGGVGKL